jgi:hypothetical protein
MTIVEQDLCFLRYTNAMRETLHKKRADYSQEQDVLSNFKVSGKLYGIAPELSCLNAIAIKVARLGVLLENKNDPKNESVKDSVLDLANYAILLAMILEESEKKLTIEGEIEHVSKD